MLDELPHDENGDILRRIQRNGDDLTKARYSKCVPELPWDVVVVKHMAPSHNGISEFEEFLDELASPLKGRNDEWGF
jgi:hypothetical protein